MATITVTVSSGSPVAKAEVAAFDSDGHIVTSGRTNSSGVWALSLDAGTYSIRVRKAGYADSLQNLTVSVDAPLAVTLTSLGINAAVAPTEVTLFGEVHSVFPHRICVRVQEVRASQWNQTAGGSPTDREAYPAFVWGEERRAYVSDGRWSIRVFAGSMVRIACEELKLDFEGIVPNGAGPYSMADLTARQVAPPHMHPGESPMMGGNLRS